MFGTAIVKLLVGGGGEEYEATWRAGEESAREACRGLLSALINKKKLPIIGNNNNQKQNFNK